MTTKITMELTDKDTELLNAVSVLTKIPRLTILNHIFTKEFNKLRDVENILALKEELTGAESELPSEPEKPIDPLNITCDIVNRYTKEIVGFIDKNPGTSLIDISRYLVKIVTGKNYEDTLAHTPTYECVKRFLYANRCKLNLVKCDRKWYTSLKMEEPRAEQTTLPTAIPEEELTYQFFSEKKKQMIDIITANPGIRCKEIFCRLINDPDRSANCTAYNYVYRQLTYLCRSRYIYAVNGEYFRSSKEYKEE